MPSHTHDSPDGDLVTYHAATGVQSIRRHLHRDHQVLGALMLPDAMTYRVHAEAHAIALTPEERGQVSEDQARAFVAGVLRVLATKHLGELDHAHLTLGGGDDVSIVAVDLVQEWLEGWAIRIENGASLA